MRYEHKVLDCRPAYKEFDDYDEPEIDALLDEMNEKISNLEKEGWKVVSCTPVLRGRHYSSTEELNYGGYGFGYAYSSTAALVVILRREAAA